MNIIKAFFSELKNAKTFAILTNYCRKQALSLICDKGHYFVTGFRSEKEFFNLLSDLDKTEEDACIVGGFLNSMTLKHLSENNRFPLLAKNTTVFKKNGTFSAETLLDAKNYTQVLNATSLNFEQKAVDNSVHCFLAVKF